MTQSAQDIRPLMEGFLSEGYLIANPPELQRLCVFTYRLLARGEPVSLVELADATSYTDQQIEELIALIPLSAYERRSDGAFTGFIGLSIEPTAHEFTIAGRTLYTWCVFDALFLPAILKNDAVLITTCPATHQEIKVSINPERATPIALPNPVMSIIAPDQKACCSDLRGAFCNHVNFFADQSAFSQWRNGANAGDCVSLDDAFVMAKSRNDARFPDVNLADLP